MLANTHRFLDRASSIIYLLYISRVLVIYILLIYYIYINYTSDIHEEYSVVDGRRPPRRALNNKKNTQGWAGTLSFE